MPGASWIVRFALQNRAFPNQFGLAEIDFALKTAIFLTATLTNP